MDAPAGGGRRGPGAALLLAGVVVLVGVVVNLWRPLAPPTPGAVDPAGWFDAATLARVDAYTTPRRLVGLVLLGLGVGVPVLVATTSRGRGHVDRLVRSVGEHRKARAAALVAASVTLGTFLVRLPLAFWSSYVHDGRYGLRTAGLGGWLRDWGLAVGAETLGAAVLAGGGWVVLRRWPRRAGRIGGLLAVGLLLALVLLRPLVWEPLWYDLRPLPPGPVRTEVERVLDAAGERVEAIRVADASRRSTRQNAYVSGLGPTRHVVLYDTLVVGRTPDEIGVVLAHELGHRRNGDIWRGTAAGAAGTLLTAGVLAAFLRRRTRTGRQRALTDPRGAAAVVALVAVLQVAGLPVQQWLSRRAEAAADIAALRLTDDPATFTAMQRGLVRSNLTDPEPPDWSVLLWGSHPAPVERLRMADAFAGGRLQ